MIGTWDTLSSHWSPIWPHPQHAFRPIVLVDGWDNFIQMHAQSFWFCRFWSSCSCFLFCAFLLIIHTYVKINHALCVCLHSYMMMRGILCIWTAAFLWCGLVLLGLQCISWLKAFEQSCMSPPIGLTAEGGVLFIAICYFPVVLLLWYPNSSLSQILLYSLYTTPFLSFCFCFFSVHYIS